MKQSLQRYNIVLYPPADVRRKAVLVSRKLREKKILFVLDDKTLIPHVTLYPVAFSQKDLPRVKALLKQIAAEAVPFQIISSTYRSDKGGYVNVGYKKSTRLHALQKQIITQVNQLLHGRIKYPGKLRTNSMSMAEREAYKRYGYKHVGRSYYPHVTFTKFDTFRPTAFSGIPLERFSFKTDRIALCAMGEYGTCTGLIETFPVSKRK